MPYSNMNPAQNWMGLGAGGLYGSFNQGGGGTPMARSEIDASRLGIGRTPMAEYPDGFLGTIRSRRDDKGRPTDTVLDGLKKRANQRSYQRGVHKGERIDPGDYLWPQEWSNTTGIENEMMGKKTVPIGIFTPATHLVNDGKVNIPNYIPNVINPVRNNQMGHMRPPWS